jgi:hypothetical protein
MLARSGPLPIEDVVWKTDDTPGGVLEQIIAMSDKGLVMVSGVPMEQLRSLLLEVQQNQANDGDATLSRIHHALGDGRATIELTRNGLRAAPAIA